MGMVKAEVEISSPEKTVRQEAVFDTGSAYTLISRELYENLKLPLFEGKTFNVEMADKKYTAKLPAALAYMTVNGCEKPIVVGIMETPAYPLIIGFLQMEAMGIKIDPKAKSFTCECR